jgi:Holliday junction resolvase RusA-like endonuclease
VGAIVIELSGPVVAMDRRLGSSGGRAYMFTPARAKSYQGDLKLMAHSAMKGKTPIDGAVVMRVWITLPIAPSWTKKKRLAAFHGKLSAVSKPDLDNVLKTVQDALSLIVFADDRQIVELFAFKKYGDKPGLRVEVEEIA